MPRFWISSALSVSSREITGVLTETVTMSPIGLNLRHPTQVRAPHGPNWAVSECAKCIKCNEITHAQICDKMPPVGIEPETLTIKACAITQITRWPAAPDSLHVGDIDKFQKL